MIRYVGGKTRHAEAITKVLMQERDGCQRYIEPFFGGGSMAKATAKLRIERFCSDHNKNLINLFRALQLGWLPPEIVSEKDYVKAKSMHDSPYKTYIGFSCSYGGKWFGGYARDATGKRDLTHESYRRILRERSSLDGINFLTCDYLDWRPGQGDLVYCDPPYSETLGYGSEFNHLRFWETMREWTANGAKVFISEYTAPSDFYSVWAKPTSVAIHNKSTGNNKLEQLWRTSI